MSASPGPDSSSIPARLRIFADDLSGAADCAASFTGAGGVIPLLLRDRPLDAERSALDTDTRALPLAEAEARSREIALAHASDVMSAAVLFKKIDSTLRGHVTEELAAFLDALPGIDRVAFTPAFPEQGRMIVDGRLLVHGVPANVELKSLRARLEMQGRPIVMPMNVREPGDLLTFVREMRKSDARTLWVGSSGLARALAGVPPRRIDTQALDTPMLMVVGSFSPAARAQVRVFAREFPGQAIGIPPQGGDMEAVAARAAGALKMNRASLLHFETGDAAPATAAREVVVALAAALREVAPLARTLVLTGGDTARAMLEALAIEALAIEGELEPGVAVSAPIEGEGFRVVLKAGGFGDNEVLLRMTRNP